MLCCLAGVDIGGRVGPQVDAGGVYLGEWRQKEELVCHKPFFVLFLHVACDFMWGIVHHSLIVVIIMSFSPTLLSGYFGLCWLYWSEIS